MGAPGMIRTAFREASGYGQPPEQTAIGFEHREAASGAAVPVDIAIQPHHLDIRRIVEISEAVYPTRMPGVWVGPSLAIVGTVPSAQEKRVAEGVPRISTRRR